MLRRGRIRETVLLFAPEVSLDLYAYASAIFLANAQRMRVFGAAYFAASHVDEL
jgi:hypothetical protein